MPLVLRPAKEDDSPKIGCIGRDAFQSTSLTELLFPPHLRSKSKTGDPARDEAEWRASRNTRRMRDGKPTFVAVDVPHNAADSEAVVGFAQWEAPSPATPAPEAAVETDDSVLPGSLDQEQLRRMYEIIESVTTKALGPDGHRKMWYLMILAVDPGQQRRGIGRMLVQHGLDQAAKAGTDAFLVATPEGRGLYYSLGFRDIGEPFTLGTTPHYPMLWKRSDHHSA